MKKLIKFVGKILAIPFSIVINITKICLVPLIFIRELLVGKTDELETKTKFGKNMFKFCMDHYKDNKPFFFNSSIAYGDDKITRSLTNARCYRDNELTELNNIISNVTKQESKKRN